MSEEKRTYDDIIKSFTDELNEKGAGIDFPRLTEEQKLDLMTVLMDECKRHIKPFVIHILGYEWYWFLEIWWANFLKYDMTCNVAARGLGKSWFWSRILPDYLAFIFNNYKVVISSFNETATFNFLKGNRQDFEFNELLKSKISEQKSMDWNKSTLDLMNGSTVKGISITSQIRGLHVNYFIADDIMNDEQKLTHEQIKAKIFGTIIPTLNRKRGKFNLIGTRFTEDDIYAYFAEKAKEEKRYRYCEFAVELDEKEERIVIVYKDENGEVERRYDEDNIYNYNELLSLKVIEPNYFAREYECRVVSDDDVPFPLTKLLEAKDKELSYELIGDPKQVYCAGLDFSNSTKKDADETVLMVGREDTDNNIIVANVYADNTLETPERMKNVKDTMLKFGRVKTLAEQNSMGLTNIQNLNKENYRLESFYTDRNKKNDITDYSSIMIKRNKVRLPYKTPKDQKFTDKLIHQLSGVRQKKTRGGLPTYTGTTKHDDFYIAFVLMMKQISNSANKPMKITGFTREQLKVYE